MSAQRHWPEYLIEAGCLGLFMVSACVFTVLLEHPSSVVHQAISNGLVRRMLMGIAMGGTAVGLIYSPMGRRSGAHMNPSMTLAFYRLGKVQRPDAVFYVVFQFLGAFLGIVVAWLLLGGRLAERHVNYVATTPGGYGTGAALVGEFVISFLLVSVVLRVSSSPRLERFTGLVAGLMVAAYITVEAPFSGMSMNPARTFGPAVFGHVWGALWVYFLAPPLGMLAAAEVFRRTRPEARHCAKLRHDTSRGCIFCGEGRYGTFPLSSAL